MALACKRLGFYRAELRHPAVDAVGADTHFLSHLGPGLTGFMDPANHFQLEFSSVSKVGTDLFNTFWLHINSLFEMSEIGRHVHRLFFKLY